MDASELRSALAGNIHALTIAERDYKKAQAEADKWESLYQRTLKVGNDESALNEIQFYKEVLTKKASNLKALLDEQKERIANLRRNFNGHSDTLNNTLTNSINCSPEQKANQLTYISQSITNLSYTDLETRIRKLERDLENMKSQLFQQQTAIVQMIELNAAALEDVRQILKQPRCQTGQMIDFHVQSQSEIQELEIDIDDELMKMKEQLSISSPNSEQSAV
ncbi:PspA/IM30 family protein [Argonema antarcticum]|uniref:PspA/IM30 family protein n=1 Tax=Argonema antarcticum TaxID=2942763 RepID=UPI0020112C5C|nr:hypothetical protein [Argonema antarcticum]MCL1473209.1 hypothetical protein [Argonema antarcticum A004/B2]